MKRICPILPFFLAGAILFAGCSAHEQTGSSASSPQSSETVSSSSSSASSSISALPAYQIAVKREELPALVVSEDFGHAKADALVQVLIDNLENETSSYQLYPLKDGFAVKNDHRYRAYLELDAQGALKDSWYFRTDESQTGHPPKLLADESPVMLNRDNGDIRFYDENFQLIKSNKIKGIDNGCAAALDASGSRAAYVLHEQDGARKGRTVTLCKADGLDILASYFLDDLGAYEGYIINGVSFAGDSVLCLKLYGDDGLGIRTLLFDLEREEVFYESAGPVNAVALDETRILLTNNFNQADGGRRTEDALVLSWQEEKITETPLGEAYQTVGFSLNREYAALAACDDDQNSVTLTAMRISDGAILWQLELKAEDSSSVAFASTPPVISEDGKNIYYPILQGVIYRAYLD